MTFSILAFNSADGAIGCAAATGNLAVGAWVLRAVPGIGAVATQGTAVSAVWGDQALARLHVGDEAQSIVATLTGEDAGRDHRQLAVLDKVGGVACFTGDQNMPARGSRSGSGWVISGNWLSSDTVLDDMANQWSNCDQEQLPFARRLISVLEAARDAGGDERGGLSAAVKVVHPSCPPLDLRVDYDEHPIAKLVDLYTRSQDQDYQAWVQRLPTLEQPHQC